ncbi:MAG: tetratricopeptide repeat protein, partial [Planctomycetia bacterium]
MLDKAVALAGENLDLKVRKELADVLLAAGEPKKALAMYVGIEPDAADRKKLAAIYSALQDFGGAERELRLAAAADPKSVDLQAMLGDVLLWNEDFAEAAAVFEKLLVARPDDWTLKTKLGQSILWGGDPAKALPILDAVLTNDLNQPEVWPVFVQAANAANGDAPPTPEIIRTAVKIQGMVQVVADPDVALLTRLAWLMHRGGDVERAGLLLDQAVAASPSEPELRRELAGVLIAADRSPQALSMFTGLDLTDEDRLQLADVHTIAKDFAAAERELRVVLTRRPGDPRIERRLAEVLTWKEDFAGAAELYTRLLQANPRDAELPVRLAQVA